MRYAFFCLLLVECTHADIGAKYTAKATGYQTEQKDTTITYDIEAISTEGARAEVYYVKGKISKSTTTIYGEMGRASVVYVFEKDRIKVSETQYVYPAHVVDLKPDSEIRVSRQRSYYIDFDGKLIGEPVPDRIDIFEEFKNTVAFKLN